MTKKKLKKKNVETETLPLHFYTGSKFACAVVSQYLLECVMPKALKQKASW